MKRTFKIFSIIIVLAMLAMYAQPAQAAAITDATLGTANNVAPANNGGNGPGGVGYTNGTSSLELWLRADRGVYEDTACSDAAETTDNVACWRDQSGNTRSYTQSTTTNQPNYFTSAQNDQPVIRFNGSTDRLTNPGSAGSVLTAGDDTFTYFASWMSNVYLWKVIYEQNHTSLEEGRRAALITTYSQNYGFNGESNDYHHAAPYTIGQYQVSSIVFNGNSSNNVVVTGNGTSYTGSINITTQNVSVDGGSAVGHKITAPEGFFNGDIPEVIVFSDALPNVERILVDNYLSAKYNVALSANDVYDGDTSGFDFGVAGIGRTGDVSHTQAHSDGMIVRNATFLQGDGDWLLFGHTAALNGNTTGNLPTGGDWNTAPDPMRWLRSFYIDMTDDATVTGGTVDIIFDLSDGGMGAPLPTGPASNYRLLGRDGTGTFTDLTTASGATVAIVGDQVQFLGVDVTVLGSNFTVGTLDYNNSPTSVEMIDLSARPAVSALPFALLGGAAALAVSAGLLLRRKAK